MLKTLFEDKINWLKESVLTKIGDNTPVYSNKDLNIIRIAMYQELFNFPQAILDVESSQRLETMEDLESYLLNVNKNLL